MGRRLVLAVAVLFSGAFLLSTTAVAQQAPDRVCRSIEVFCNCGSIPLGLTCWGRKFQNS